MTKIKNILSKLSDYYFIDIEEIEISQTADRFIKTLFALLTVFALILLLLVMLIVKGIILNVL